MTMDHTARLGAVREAMASAAHEAGTGVDALIVPSADAHQNEYVPDAWRRREWVCGFDGSAGDLLVTRAEALLWTDGRYWSQAAQQLDASCFGVMRSGAPGEPTMTEWLCRERGWRSGGAVVGVDARLMTLRAFEDAARALARAGARLVALGENPVDRAWRGRPALPASPVVAHPVERAGRTAAEKLGALREAMREKGATAHALTELDAIAWLFNLRGADVAHNPVFLSYALVTLDDATLFTNTTRVRGDAQAALAGAADVRPYEDFEASMRRAASAHGGSFWIDEQSASVWAASLVGGGAGIAERSRSPVVGAKARKNDVEIAGARAAHVRDGAALARFLSWLEREGLGAGMDEVGAAARLRAERAAEAMFVGESFDTIAGYGPNGAIVHYRARPGSARTIGDDALFLLDSGGQYLDGTTDVTRTVRLGAPTGAERRDCTLVLKAHVALASARFPMGTTGGRLDALARAPLWAHARDYAHGTGHGVGAHLCVHESPPNIGVRAASLSALEPGMILSIEPGLYVEGSHGVRIENLYVVVADPDAPGWLRFDVLTMVPLQRSLIDESMLTPGEAAWVDAYHRRVRASVGPTREGAARAWLEGATRGLGEA